MTERHVVGTMRVTVIGVTQESFAEVRVLLRSADGTEASLLLPAKRALPQVEIGEDVTVEVIRFVKARH